MQLSRLRPQTRLTYVGKVVEVKSQLIKTMAVIKSFHNSSKAIIEYEKVVTLPYPKQTKKVLTIDVSNIHI